ncbi:MAG: efflux RND transporter permease subunit [Acidobacteriota bacterium]
MQKLAEICIERPVFATMLILALSIIGAFSYKMLGVDRFPKVDFPIVTVTTLMRGASPEELETEVTKRVEEAVNTLAGIDEIRSVSSEGVSQVFVTFVLERDIDQAAQDVRDKISGIIRDLPRDADPPVVEKIDPDSQPIMSVVVSARRSAREITDIADKKIKQQIESLSGVGQVRFIGARKRQIQVWLDAEKLASYNLTVPQIEAALTTQNLELPGGRINEGDREQVLRTLGRVSTSADFNKIVVSNTGNTPVRISDLGYVEDGVEEQRSLAKLDGSEAVILEIRKQSGTNTLEVVSLIKARIAELSRQLPPDFHLQVIRDQSLFIKSSFEAIEEHLILGGILAALVVLLFMRNLRSTVIAAIAIPTSIVSTYALMYYKGFTLNDMTMLALVLSVGIVIDDAIVVLENIYRFIEEKRMSPHEAAREATREIGLAVMATTFSLIIIFLPLAFVTGLVGRFMESFGLTAAFAIGVSLFVSFTLTPMMCSRFLKSKSAAVEKQAAASSKQSWFYQLLERGYLWLLHLSMRHRFAIVLLTVITIATTVPLFQLVGKDFIPKDDTNDFEITVRAPEGYSLAATAAIMEKLEAEVRQLSGISHLLTIIGADSQHTVNLGNIYVQLTDISQRSVAQAEIMERARDLLAKYQQNLRISVGYLPSISGRSASDILYSVRGPDLNQLTSYSDQIINIIKSIPGVVDTDSSLITGKPETRLYIDRDRAADLGVRVSDIAATLRTLVGGNDRASNFRDGEDRYDVLLRAQLANRNSKQAISLLTVPSSKLGTVRLDQVVRMESGTGPAQIDRYNRQRQVLISANIERGQSLGPAMDTINAGIAKMHLPPEYTYGVQGRSRELLRAVRGFGIVFLLALAFMYMILAAQFESFIDPVTILISLPLSVPFALLSLVITNQALNIFSAFGVLMLFGIVKKNSILQIDYANSLRKQGLDVRKAAIEASRERLRPILMTTLALIAGMMPMAVGQGAGVGSRRSVAIVIIGGQTLCLILTLLVTPVFYSLFEDLVKSPYWSEIARAVTIVRQRTTTLLSALVNIIGRG